MRRHAGQAAADYVAILAVVLVVLAGGAAAALAVPGVAERVIATVRTGICIVGGDVCRTADARAAGLAPCLTAARAERTNSTLDLAVVRLGEHGEWQLALRSDGSATVTRTAHGEVGGTLGIGVEFSPAHVEAAVSGALVAGYRGGRTWRFPDAGAARAFLAAAMRDDGPTTRRPDATWHALTQGAGAKAGVALLDLAEAGMTAGAGMALGVRDEGARRTVTLEVGTVAPHVFAEVPGFSTGSGVARSVVADVVSEGGEPRELVLLTALARDGRLDELTARLDLREAATRALARRVLRPGSATSELRALVLHAAEHGIVEQTSYAVSERRGGFDVAARLGLSLGLAHERAVSARRLVDAVAWVRGGPPRRRSDCLGP